MDVRMRGLCVALGVVVIMIITFAVATIAHGTASANSKLKLIDDRRHQGLTEISVIDGIRQKLIAGNSSYYLPPNGTGFGFGAAPTVYNNSAVATKHAINTLVGTLKPLSSDTRIKGGIDDAIQALKTRDANKALLLLNQARNGINHQLANLPISRSNSTLRSNNTNSTL
jgi:hypothetical protein